MGNTNANSIVETEEILFCLMEEYPSDSYIYKTSVSLCDQLDKLKNKTIIISSDTSDTEPNLIQYDTTVKSDKDYKQFYKKYYVEFINDIKKIKKLKLVESINNYINEHEQVKQLTGDCLNKITYDLHLIVYGGKRAYDSNQGCITDVPFKNMNIVHDILKKECDGLKKYNVAPEDIIHMCYHDCIRRKKACCEYHTFCINKICTLCETLQEKPHKKHHKKRHKKHHKKYKEESMISF